MIRAAVAAIAIAAATASGASAANVLFAQDFNSLPQGTPAPSVPGFTITGTVDVVTSGNFGINCVGGTGACVDIDGSPGPGAMTSTAIAFAAGKPIIVSFDLSGSQRTSTADAFIFNLTFAAPLDYSDFLCTSGFVGCGVGGGTDSLQLGPYNENIGGATGWQNYSFTFTPLESGTLQLYFASPSADNIGPMLDNVLVSQVPEPASWALLIAGFGLTGAVMRRRRVAVAA